MFNKIIISLLIIASLGMAQNLQLHYEASGDREYVVSTLEMFKPDQHGSTFWFVDMEYNAPGIKGVSLAYWEIARSFTLPVENVSATLQYNDGVIADFGNLGQVWLVGLNYYLDLGFVALPIDVLYRSLQGSDSHDFQVTTSWFMPLMDGKLEFAGFIDFWSEDLGGDSEKMVLLTEPQLWYNLNETISIGSEVEISNNFIFGKDGIQALPTLGLRWNF